MVWLEVSVATDGEGAEAVADALRPFAYQHSVVLEQRGDETDAAPDALESSVTVKIYVPEDEDSPALRRRIQEILYHLGRLYPLPPPVFTELADEDWAYAWKAKYHPFRIGKRIWIRPSWSDPIGPERRKADDIVLELDPGMAFGTGTHPTTQLCVMALEEIVHEGARVLDLGTGSAILALVAASLGAGQSLGIDIDEQAVKAAEANVTHNELCDRIQIRQGTLKNVADRPWDIVVVNILPDVILSMLDEGGLMAYVAATGWLILSGIIGPQMDGVAAAVSNAGGSVVRTLTMGDWVALVVKHRDAV